MIAPVSYSKITFTSDTSLYDARTYENVRNFLVRSNIDKVRYTLEGASEQCSVPPYVFLRIVNSSQNINNLWKEIQCDASEYIRLSQPPSISQEIFKMLQEAKESGKSIRLIQAIAAHTRLAVPTVRYIIDSDVIMSEMYKSIIASSRSRYSEEEVEEQNRTIEKILLDSIKEKLSISCLKIANISGLSLSVVQKRILNSDYLNDLYIKMNAVSSEYKASISSNTEYLKPKTECDLISALKKSPMKPTMIELSRITGYSLNTIKKTISSSRTLQDLWFIEPNLNTKTDKQKAEIKKLIVHAIEDLKQSDERLNLNTLSIQTGITQPTIRFIIESDRVISAMYQKAKNN